MKLSNFSKEELNISVVGFCAYENVMNEPESLFIFQGRLCVPDPVFKQRLGVDVFTNERISIDENDIVTEVKLEQ